MKIIYLQILVIILILLGEGFAIYSEMAAAKQINQSKNNFHKIFLKMILIATIAGILLILGYTLGYQSFKNIWIVGVISITSILILEPILAFTIFKEFPTKGAIIGFTLEILGFLATIFID